MTHDDQRDEVSKATRHAEEEAQSAHEGGRPASTDEEAALNDEPVDEDVRTHYRDMTERGASEQGEGRIP